MMTPHEFASLVDAHGPALYLCSRQWCPTPEDGGEEAVIKLMGQRRPPPEVVPWLYRVVRNASIDADRVALRRQRRESAVARPTRWFVEAEVDGLDAESAVVGLQRLPADE